GLSALKGKLAASDTAAGVDVQVGQVLHDPVGLGEEGINRWRAFCSGFINGTRFVSHQTTLVPHQRQAQRRSRRKGGHLGKMLQRALMPSAPQQQVPMPAPEPASKMLKFLNLADSYVRVARFFPALLTGMVLLPLLVMAGVAMQNSWAVIPS